MNLRGRQSRPGRTFARGRRRHMARHAACGRSAPAAPIEADCSPPIAARLARCRLAFERACETTARMRRDAASDAAPGEVDRAGGRSHAGAVATWRAMRLAGAARPSRASRPIARRRSPRGSRVAGWRLSALARRRRACVVTRRATPRPARGCRRETALTSFACASSNRAPILRSERRAGRAPGACAWLRNVDYAAASERERSPE